MFIISLMSKNHTHTHTHYIQLSKCQEIQRIEECINHSTPQICGQQNPD